MTRHEATDHEALEAHCRLAFATWSDGQTVNYQLGAGANNAPIERAWSAMSETDKAHWRALWAPLFPNSAVRSSSPLIPSGDRPSGRRGFRPGFAPPAIVAK